MSNRVPIIVACGDGIGPEFVDASRHIIKPVVRRIQTEVIEIGEKVGLRGNATGLPPSAQGQ
jgi:isocitrate dehydrogenase